MPALRLAWGAEVRRETAQSLFNFDDNDTLDGLLGRINANLEWRVRPDLLLQGGAMLEHHYYTGLDISPRVALNYDFAPDQTLHLNVSQAYRTPTFVEQEGNIVYRTTTGLPADIRTVPPADLQPERIRSHEIGYVGHSRRWGLQLDAKLFYDTIDRYISNDNVALAGDSAPSGIKLLHFRWLGWEHFLSRSQRNHARMGLEYPVSKHFNLPDGTRGRHETWYEANAYRAVNVLEQAGA